MPPPSKKIIRRRRESLSLNDHLIGGGAGKQRTSAFTNTPPIKWIGRVRV
jgi:hypothetical protein